MNIIGRLTRDAELRNLSNQKQVVNFFIATNDNYHNKQGERIERTTYFDCCSYYWISPKITDFLTKDTLVELAVPVSSRTWTGADHEPKAGLNFHTSQINFYGAGKKVKNIMVTKK